MAEQTVQDVWDSMTSEQQDVVAFVLGATDDDVSQVSDDDLWSMIDVFDSMTQTQRDTASFIIGNANDPVQHSGFDFESHLAHHGVKGMHWGVRRNRSSDSPRLSDRALAPVTKNGQKTTMAKVSRDELKRGVSSGLGAAHMAGIKSKGHRLANALLGDKTYWKRNLAITGIATGVIGASFATAGLMPAGALTGLGLHALAAGGGHVIAVGSGAHTVATVSTASGTYVATSAKLIALGKGVIMGIGSTAAVAGAGTAGLANAVSNEARAIRGNARINKSYESLGQHIYNSAQSGNKKVVNTLTRNGSLSKRDLTPKVRHSSIFSSGLNDWRAEGNFNNVLEHVGNDGSSDNSSSVVIVAIPKQDDYVWRISSEKVPHMTMLFLGNVTDPSALADISNWVEQVAKTSMSRFGMEVESRGSLGPDDADVLFFGKHNVKKLEAARSYMLTNVNVKAAYDAAPQYEGWTPHLTLGYPASPAKEDARDYPGFSWVNFDKIAVWFGDSEGPTFELGDDDSFHDEIQMSDILKNALTHHGVKGMRWGVRRDERQLSLQDKALNISQRSQVKVASAVSALTAIGISSNAAATAFQLQTRWEHIKMIEAIMQQAQNNPLLSDAGREALKQTRNKVIKGLVASAAMTTAISTTIGVVTHRTAKAYFAPIHKVYGDAKPKIKSEMRQLAKDIKSGKHPSMTTKEYNAKIAEIVARHMTADKKNILQPFHELARSQLGTDYNTKQLKITFEKLPNTDLYSKMTVVTPNGLKLVKAIKNVEHADLGDDGVSFKDMDLYFDYVFDQDGFITDFSCPTLEIANDMFEGRLDVDKLEQSFAHSDVMENALAHFGVKGMRWGVRKPVDPDTGLVEGGKAEAKARSVHSPGGMDGDKNTSTDHERAVNAMAKMHERGTAALSNEEIKAIQNRVKAMNELEKLTSNQKSDIQARIDKMKAENELAGLIAARKEGKRGPINGLVRSLIKNTADQAVKELGKQAGNEIAGQLLKQMGVQSSKGKKNKDQEENTKSESKKSDKKPLPLSGPFSQTEYGTVSAPKSSSSKRKTSTAGRVKRAFNDVFPDTVPFDKTPPPRPKWDGKVHKITSL